MAVVRRSDPTPLLLWSGVNLLNLLDAVLTQRVVSTGVAREANPLIDVIGLDGKLVLVLVASSLLAVLRPRALLVPLVALGAVVVYTTVGIAVSA